MPPPTAQPTTLHPAPRRDVLRWGGEGTAIGYGHGTPHTFCFQIVLKNALKHHRQHGTLKITLNDACVFERRL